MALTAPEQYNYAFVYNESTGRFNFTDGTNVYVPEFTRTAEGIYFNYEYIGDAEGLLPFEITLIFNRSNTSWTLGTTGYIATDTKIGADNNVGFPQSKWFIFISNDTINNYLLIADLSSGLNGSGTIIIYNNFETPTAVINTNALNNVFMPSKINLSYFRPSGSSLQAYIDALYWQDLGQSAAYTAGLTSALSYLPSDTAMKIKDNGVLVVNEIDEISVKGTNVKAKLIVDDIEEV